MDNGGTPSVRYKRYVLACLTLVCTLNYLDRGLIILLLEPIKRDLRLSDTELGFLTGIAFGLFYAVLGVPIARWADRGNRVTVTALAIGLWGVTVTACMLVTTFVQLAVARVAAAVGEAGCMPPTYSLLGDYFAQPAERTRAMSIYMLSGPVATLVSFMLGGSLEERFGWRAAFGVMGLPALLVAVLIKNTVGEPRIRLGFVTAGRDVSTTFQILQSLWVRHSTRHLALAIIVVYMMGLGLAPWYAVFMIRSHGMGTAELGVWLGLIFGVAGFAGILIGGYGSARWLANDERTQLRISAWATAALLPCYAAFLLVPQKAVALLALIPLVLLFSVFLGPTFAILQRLVPGESRATTMAIVMMLANLIGMGLGPQAVGFGSDLFAPSFGKDSLRVSMLILSFVAVWGAYHFWSAATLVTDDLRRPPA